jgi:hypothetical protein
MIMGWESLLLGSNGVAFPCSLFLPLEGLGLAGPVLPELFFWIDEDREGRIRKQQLEKKTEAPGSWIGEREQEWSRGWVIQGNQNQRRY